MKHNINKAGHPTKTPITRRHGETKRKPGGQCGCKKDRGTRKKRCKPLRASRGMGRRSRPAGGGEDVRANEAERGREGPLEWITPRGLQGPGHKKKEIRGRQTDKRQGSHGHVERNSRGRPTREESAETSGGGRRVGATSGCTVAPHQGDFGEENQVKQREWIAMEGYQMGGGR